MPNLVSTVVTIIIPNWLDLLSIQIHTGLDAIKGIQKWVEVVIIHLLPTSVRNVLIEATMMAEKVFGRIQIHMEGIMNKIRRGYEREDEHFPLLKSMYSIIN